MTIGSLFTRHGSALLALARRITGNDADAEEVVGEVFVALVEGRVGGRTRLDPSRDALPYLRKAVTNRALNHLRRRRRAPRSVPGAVLDAQAAPPNDALLLRDGLARLPRRQAQVFALRHLDGHSTADIAQALGIAPATVRVHLHQAARSLRRLFDKKEAPRA